MDLRVRDVFIERWSRYFGGGELPIVFFYTDEEAGARLVAPPAQWRCFVCDLGRVRRGQALSFNLDSLTCDGARRYLGFIKEYRENFEYFLSCGLPGKEEGERYKKSPELVRVLMQEFPDFEPPASSIVFKRWDRLEESDHPEVVIFFARPDVLSGLFTLAGFDRPDRHGVTCPFAAGCGSIVMHPYLEKDADNPRAVLGMFDVSARPCVPADTLTLAVPMKKFVRMIEDMDESFLITKSWDIVRKRIGRRSSS
jgi:uncharacterized protein (DUF169 family)